MKPFKPVNAVAQNQGISCGGWLGERKNAELNTKKKN